jgi:hypothetical protein
MLSYLVEKGRKGKTQKGRTEKRGRRRDGERRKEKWQQGGEKRAIETDKRGDTENQYKCQYQ